ncbi:helix-turn-helix domain-containing protein [Niallia circulans]|uniref:helix-turn-helix domain-containing protein n=1 Tax=Niallia circulans TaxID=1397 RepID=UPI0039A18003
MVGQALRLERKRLGLTLNQIGKILGTSPSRISNLENGNGVMLANHLIASYKLVLDMKN